MSRLAAWAIGFLSVPVWFGLLIAVGSWLGSTIQEFGTGFVFVLVALGPLPLIVALALRRGDLGARPLRAAAGAGLAVGGFLVLLLVVAFAAVPFMFFHPAGWLAVAILFLIPVVVWPLMLRRAQREPREQEPQPERDRDRDREVIRFP